MRTGKGKHIALNFKFRKAVGNSVFIQALGSARQQGFEHTGHNGFSLSGF